MPQDVDQRILGCRFVRRMPVGNGFHLVAAKNFYRVVAKACIQILQFSLVGPINSKFKDSLCLVILLGCFGSVSSRLHEDRFWRLGKNGSVPFRCLSSFLPFRVRQESIPRGFGGRAALVPQHIDQRIFGFRTVRRNPIPHRFHTMLGEQSHSVVPKTSI